MHAVASERYSAFLVIDILDIFNLRFSNQVYFSIIV